ncbi:hypothetical protein [Kitasatospora sp. NPDC017646]
MSAGQIAIGADDVGDGAGGGGVGALGGEFGRQVPTAQVDGPVGFVEVA